MPVVVADALAPPVNGERIFRLSADPLRRRLGGQSHHGPHRVHRPPRRPPEGLGRRRGRRSRPRTGSWTACRPALALDPALAAEAEGTIRRHTADVEVVVQTHEPGTPLFPIVQEAVIGDRYTASFLAAEPVALAGALDSLSDREIVSNPALLVASRSFDENFLRSSKIGRRGDVRVYGEVAPDTGDSLLYTKLVLVDLPGRAGRPSTGCGGSWPARRSWPRWTRARPPAASSKTSRS